MTVSVASQTYRAIGLSEVGRLVLGLIGGGTQWLDWAMTVLTPNYRFADESAFVAAVQCGMHDTPYLTLPRTGLIVSPVRLMTLPAPDLRTLARAEAGTDPAPGAAVAAILTAQGLATNADLALATNLPAALGVAHAPVFQAMDLDDQLALLTLQREIGLPGGGLSLEAAVFASGRAQSPVEFVDYYRAALAYWAATSPASARPVDRANGIVAAVDTLLPLTFALLDSPSVDGLVAPWDVRQAIDEWLMLGRQIGFARSSLAIQQIIAYGGYTGQTGADAVALVRDYVARAQTLLNSAELGSGVLGQDGATCVFPIASNGDVASVELGPTGIITLRRFVPAPPPAPAVLTTGATS